MRKVTQKELDALRSRGRVVTTKKKAEDPEVTEQRLEQMRKELSDAVIKEMFGVLYEQGRSQAEIARMVHAAIENMSNPTRKPTPYRCEVRRDSDGLIESVYMQPVQGD